MFSIIDQSTWTEPIQDLETTDPLLGGANGHLTQASQALANRTRYLKDQIDALFVAGTLVYDSERLGGKTLAEVQTIIVDAITNGAGTAYDTLLEIQNEIVSNDTDIESLLNNLSLKANKNGDNTQLFKVANAQSADEAVSKAQMEAAIGNINIATQIHASTEKINIVDADEFAIADSGATFSLKKFTWANMKSKMLSYLSIGFSASFTTNGYIAFPTWLGGFIMQWGYVLADVGSKTITFPITFPTACLNLSVSGYLASDTLGVDNTSVPSSIPTRSSFTISLTTLHTGAYWIALGR